MQTNPGVYFWSKKEGITPCLIAVSSAIIERRSLSGKIDHPCWVLDYTAAAAGRYRVGSMHAPWKERSGSTAHLYPPRTAYWEDTRGIAGALQGLWIMFTGGAAAGLGALANTGAVARLDDHQGILAGRLKRIAACGSEEGFWEAQSVLCDIIGILLQAGRTGKETWLIGAGGHHAAALPPLSQVVRDYFRIHLGERVRLRDLAWNAGVSVSSLSHRYREENGESPMETLMKMRLNLAKVLLLKGERLKNIAGAAGFADEFHFSKTFKRREGASPRNYLRRLSEKTVV